MILWQRKRMLYHTKMDYQGILVHDYDVTFYNYGADYQECFAHVLRYLKDSIDNKPDQEKISGFEKNIRLCWKQEQAVNSNTDTDEKSGTVKMKAV